MADYRITNDMLIRQETAYTGEGGFSYIKGTLIITKEEFIACYNAWIKNTNSVQCGESMTEEKAIELLKTIKINSDGQFEDLGTWYKGIDEDYTQALEMSIKALEEKAQGER